MLMQPLDKALRNRLERAIKDAREIAEDAARAALEQLGVGEAAPFAHLSESDRELRRGLRVHGRQLGDLQNDKGAQEIDRLTEEVAYEHWHRMLFARFLAENNLLMYPDPDDPVAVTLEECEDLAPDEGATHGWELAARFAARMLPQIFRLDSPVFQLTLAPESQQKLERLVSDLSPDVFTASDSLGWVYQFWQAKKKEAVNASEVKIGARELPAVTQLFTEPYMVSFLLDNSLGAWWVGRRMKDEGGGMKFATEDEARKRYSIPGVSLEYLRFVGEEPQMDTDGHRSGEKNICVHPCSSVVQKWVPAAGTFDGWPERLADLKTLDPCCGSGHFLVAAFLMLVPMRMELDGLSAREAVDAVLRENIHGLELDQRCVELAAFALALTAWKYPGAGGYRVLPELNVACSGLSVSVAKEEWKQLGLGKRNLTIALDWMHDTFKDAPVLGSLLDPKKHTLGEQYLSLDELSGALDQALKQEQNEERQEVAVVAHGLAKAATLLGERYQWVITNVPYLARGKQDERLRDFCEQHYSAAKNDLATVFLERCLELCVEGGTSSIVLPQNWLFLTSYKKFREKLLKNDTWHLIARLGPQAFQTPMWDFNVQLITISRGNGNQSVPLWKVSRPSRSADSGSPDRDGLVTIRGIDVSEPRTATEKAAQLLTAEIKSVEQAKQLENPDASITLEEMRGFLRINTIAQPYKGLGTGDDPRYRNKFWELGSIDDSWIVFRSAPEATKTWGAGNSDILRWDNGKGELSKSPTAYLRNTDQWANNGILFGMMRQLPGTIYSGSAWDTTSCALVPKVASLLAPLWCFVESKDLSKDLRLFNQKLSVEVNHFGQVPFDLEHWTQVAKEKYPNGLPKPYTNDPTQWIFHGHPCGSVIWDETQKWTTHGPLRTDDTVLHIALARLIGYRWPAELEPQIDADEHRSEEGKIIRGNPCSSVVQERMELADEQREWVNRCAALASFADEDGIICIPPVRGEASASDRLLNLLAAAYEQANEPQIDTDQHKLKNDDNIRVHPCSSVVQNSFNNYLQELLKNANHAGKTLETWLRDKFFTQHCKLFQHRPFIWHIWDGLRDGFAALVNYHKLDAKLLETLIYTYLGDWISRQKPDIANSVDGAQERLAAAEALKKKLELILEGEAPYDIFVRWKPLEKQPIGWDPDLNDGVRLNIRPWLTVPDVGKRGAGVLRDRPNIHWNKDRGKDVASAPWFEMFGGDRINDHHLSLAEKHKARTEEK